MNFKKSILIIFTVFLTGIIIGGLAVYFIKSKNIEGVEKTEKEIQLWTCPMHPEVILEEPGDCPKCGMKLVPVKRTFGIEKESPKQEIQLWTCPMHPEVIVDKPGDCPKCGMKLVPIKKTTPAKKPKDKRKILYWRAPMDPTEIYDHPGKSKMGMDLIPVYEDEQVLGRGGVITIDPITVQNIGVKTTKVKRGDLRRIIRTVGTIDYDERKLYRINTKISGWIEKLYVNYKGQEVKKGDILLEIYSPELVSTQEEYLSALKNFELVKESPFKEIRESAESLVKSTKRRLELWDIPKSEIEALEKRGTIVKTMKLLSPVNGIVIHKNVEEGMFVKEGMDLFHIADLSTVWVYVTVYEYELPWVKVGQEAEMELSYIPGKIFKGKVDYIYPFLKEKTRDVKVRLIFPNPNLELKPNMYANIRIHAPVKKNTLIIPDNAVIRTGERNIVFVVRGEGKFEPREIKLGVEGENNYVQVIQGLLEGEEIVTSAQFLLDSESRIQEAIQKMIEEKIQKIK